MRGLRLIRSNIRSYSKLVPGAAAKNFTAEDLNQVFPSTIYVPPDKKQLQGADNFFKNARITLEWTVGSFTQIPGERERKRRADDERAKQELYEELDENEDFDEEVDFHEDSLGPSIQNTRGIESEELETTIETVDNSKDYPEVLFIGKCNTGKSSLINALITPNNEKYQKSSFAHESKKAGFTKTLNCYNFANSFRLIDSPGYGMKGSTNDGELIFEYVKYRRQLTRAFLLVSSDAGFSKFDRAMMEFLSDCGVPFEIVFTKTDKIISKLKTPDAVISDIQGKLLNEKLDRLAMAPRALFCNSQGTNAASKRHGISNIRYTILEACGYSQPLVPKQKRKPGAGVVFMNKLSKKEKERKKKEDKKH